MISYVFVFLSYLLTQLLEIFIENVAHWPTFWKSLHHSENYGHVITDHIIADLNIMAGKIFAKQSLT